MKHSKKSSSSSRLVCDDDPSLAALREMAREQSLVTQLRAVVLPAIQLAGGERAEVVAQMFENILDCSAKAIAALKLLRLDHSQVDGALLATVMVDDKTRVRKLVTGDGEKDGDDNVKPLRRQRKRRSLADDSVALETPVPHYDGHQWRKYGQKVINHTKHPRSYYKCTYKQEQNCRATKTVQQQQQDGGGIDDDPVMYTVVYYGQHTCKPGQTDAAMVETASTGYRCGGSSGDELARSDSQCSNISVTCTSVVVDHHQTTTTSLESSCNLLDMAGDFATAEVNQYDQLFEVAFPPLHLGAAWEMDVSGHGIPKFGGW